MLTSTDQLKQILAIPPESLDPRQHQNPVVVAHAALENLRKEGDNNFLFLRSCLELTSQQLQHQDEELLFHCITGCRQVMLQQWSKYTQGFLNIIRSFFFHLGHSQSLSRTCQYACYTLAVAFWKRSWNEEPSPHSPPSPAEEALIQQLPQLPSIVHCPSKLFSELEKLMRSNPEAASRFLSCLVGEFAGKSSVNYGLPLEFHKTAHRTFEKQHLGQLLQLAMQSISSNTAPPAATVQLILDILNWEFGLTAWSVGFLGASITGRTLIRPPFAWRDSLLQLDLLRALFYWHQNSQQQQQKLLLRQWMIAMSSINGPIFQNDDEKRQYAAVLLEGALPLLPQGPVDPDDEISVSQCLDSLQLVSRLVSNFKLSLLSGISKTAPLLQQFTATGNQLLASQRHDCQAVQGDVEAMNGREFREEATAIVLEGSVLMCGDPWLLYTGTEESRKEVQRSLSSILGPLYGGFVECRTNMAALEEHYLTSHAAELDDVQEDIVQADLEEELASVATVGRLDLGAAIRTLSYQFQQIMPALEGLWRGSGEVTPETAAMLEHARLLNMYIMHLLADNNDGEDPTIPIAVLAACQENPALSSETASAVEAVLQFAEAQTRKISENPENRRLSPLLASSFLLFMQRWAPAYICPEELSASAGRNAIVQEWSSFEKAQQSIGRCISICLIYNCFWPQEEQVQENASKVLMSLARRGPRLRGFMVESPIFQQLIRFHVLTADVRHSTSRAEFENTIQYKTGAASLDSNAWTMIWGYQRLPYTIKRQVFTAILVACSDTNSEKSNEMLNESLKSVHDAFSKFVALLSSAPTSQYQDVNAKEMACLCIEMMCGIAHASDMKGVERIPPLLTTYIPELSSLMEHYAEDLTICESLLRFFRDYTECYIATLDRNQSLVLFDGAAKLLRSYSQHHCKSRSVVKTSAEAEAEEEKAYSDILCVIQLLINLGTKDFVDSCGSNGVDSSQVTDMIFFGLQQILPLMTQGLLQFPNLCSLFFELVGFMTDMYPEKLSFLPHDLFMGLLESLLFGMSHYSGSVAKLSLYGLASIAKEHIRSQALKPHLEANPAILDRCSKQLLTEVIFQPIVTDRVEAAGMALLPLAAVDINRFAGVVTEITSQVPDASQQRRLESAFEKLVQPEMLSKVSAEGYEGRMNRARFRECFETFVNEIHIFLVLR